MLACPTERCELLQSLYWQTFQMEANGKRKVHVNYGMLPQFSNFLARKKPGNGIIVGDTPPGTGGEKFSTLDWNFFGMSLETSRHLWSVFFKNPSTVTQDKNLVPVACIWWHDIYAICLLQSLKWFSCWCRSSCPGKSIFAWTRNDFGWTNACLNINQVHLVGFYCEVKEQNTRHNHKVH